MGVNNINTTMPPALASAQMLLKVLTQGTPRTDAVLLAHRSHRLKEGWQAMNECPPQPLAVGVGASNRVPGTD
jgi:hypothetical protein